jgi:hypothetical protein
VVKEKVPSARTGGKVDVRPASTPTRDDAVPFPADADAWSGLAQGYVELRDRLTTLLRHAGLSPSLQRELILRADAAAQASKHARAQAGAIFKAETMCGGRP